jgi:outer membrane protein TolC
MPGWLNALCVLAIAGCAVGPNFHSPRTTMPGRWIGTTSAPTTASTQAVNLAQWWASFDDPMLDRLVDQAVNTNLDIQQAQARILQARGVRNAAIAGFFPGVNATAGFTRSRAGSGALGSPVNNLFQVGLDASWEMDIFGRIRRNVEAATADLQASQEDCRRWRWITFSSAVSSGRSSSPRTT